MNNIWIIVFMVVSTIYITAAAEDKPAKVDQLETKERPVRQISAGDNKLALSDQLESKSRVDRQIYGRPPYEIPSFRSRPPPWQIPRYRSRPPPWQIPGYRGVLDTLWGPNGNIGIGIPGIIGAQIGGGIGAGQGGLGANVGAGIHLGGANLGANIGVGWGNFQGRSAGWGMDLVEACAVLCPRD